MDGRSILLAALCLPQLGPPDPDIVLGESAPSRPDFEYRVVSDLTRVQVDEVGAIVPPVERSAAVLARGEGDLLSLEGVLYRVSLHMLLLIRESSKRLESSPWRSAYGSYGVASLHRCYRLSAQRWQG